MASGVMAALPSPATRMRVSPSSSLHIIRVAIRRNSPASRRDRAGSSDSPRSVIRPKARVTDSPPSASLRRVRVTGRVAVEMVFSSTEAAGTEDSQARSVRTKADGEGRADGFGVMGASLRVISAALRRLLRYSIPQAGKVYALKAKNALFRGQNAQFRKPSFVQPSKTEKYAILLIDSGGIVWYNSVRKLYTCPQTTFGGTAQQGGNTQP